MPGTYNFYRRLNGENKLSTESNRKYIQNTLLALDLKYGYLKPISEREVLNKAFARQYLNFAIYNYPRHKLLSKIAISRYRRLSEKINIPNVGGKFFQFIAEIFGWRTARILRYNLRERL